MIGRSSQRQAARQLFADKGFTATTISEIATAAGVSAATVYAAFDSKAGVVAAMLEDLEEGIDLGRRINEMLAEPDPYRQLRLYVSAHCALFANGADILRAAMRAIEAPEVASFVEKGDQHRRQAIDILIGIWEKAGALRPSLSHKEASDRLWLLTTVEGFLNAVERLGWNPGQYEAWLASLAEIEILKPRS